MNESARTKPGIELGCCLWLTDSQAYHYPAPLARHPLISRLWLVRSHESPFGRIPRTEYILTSRFTPLRLPQMLRHCARLARRPEVRGFVSFNPFPYGILALAAAARHRKPVHFVFIGSDWYTFMQGAWRPLLLPVVRRASFLTATGERMRRDMMAAGIGGEKIAVLPHCIDIERYPPGDPAAAEYASIYVGKLIPRKRVDVIIRAFADVRKRHATARLCIVGDGPLMADLCALAARLGIADAVDFTGYTPHVQRYLSAAKINVIASSEEGFPFSLVEGICCGAVPVSTPVGTIPDLIEDGRNGFLYPLDDPVTLASHINRLLADPALYDSVRRGVLGMREGFSYDRATAVWDPWLQSLAEGAAP